jgi:hypothetical protein
LILRALERGLALRDFEIMTVGMILGVIVAYDNERIDSDEDESTRAATQTDFDRW